MALPDVLSDYPRMYAGVLDALADLPPGIAAAEVYATTRGLAVRLSTRDRGAFAVFPSPFEDMAAIPVAIKDEIRRLARRLTYQESPQ